MALKLQNLDRFQKLVNEDGTPTPYFIRLLQIANLVADDTAAEVEGAAPASRLINTDAPLIGGGDLSADLTLGLGASGVAPGSYTNTDLTVDEFGRVTAAANGSGGGGGGTGPTPVVRSVSTAAGSGGSINISLPGGSVAGDTCLIFVQSGYQNFAPVGWQIVDGIPSTANNYMVWGKELTSGDISAGSVTFTFANSFRHNLIAVTLIGALTGPIYSNCRQISGDGRNATLQGNRKWRTDFLGPNTILLVSVAIRGNGTFTLAEGTMLASFNNGDGSTALWAVASADPTGQTTTIDASSVGSQDATFCRIALASP